MPLQQELDSKTVFVYVLFMVWAIFSVFFMFTQLSVVALLKISIYTTPIIMLNLFAVGIYVFMPPHKKVFGIVCSLLWAFFCALLFASQFFEAYRGTFGTFIWFGKNWPYEVLLAVAIAISLYLIFIPFKMVSLSMPVARCQQGVKDFFTGIVLPIFAGFSGGLFHAVNNADFLNSTTCIIFVTSFMLMAIMLYALLAFATHKILPYGDASLAVALGILCWLFLPTMVAQLRLFYHPLWLHVSFLTIVPLLLFYLFHQKPKLVLLYLLISIPISGYNYWEKQPFDTAKARQVESLEPFKLPAFPSAAVPQDAPNVYIIVYDGTPNLQMLKKLDVDGSDLKDTLQKESFTVYDNTYSIAQISLTSMSSTYNMSKPLTGAEIIWQANGGLAAGFEVFRKNGYRVQSIQQSFMTGTYQHFDVNLPPREFVLVDKGDFLFFLYKALFFGEYQFEDIISAGGDLSPHKQTLLESPVQRSITVMHNYYPGHSQLSGKCLPNQKEIYEAQFAVARDMLRQDLDRIARNDPKAIVVVMGDHGPYLTSDCTSLAKRDPESVTEEEVFDRFSTLVAIRWPDAEKGAKYGKDIRINQDILPVIFAYLYDSPEPLQWRIEPKAYLNGRLVIDNGAYCPVPKGKE